MLSIIAITTRILQGLLGVAIFGLSMALVKGQEYGSAPALTQFSAFLGIFGIVIAIVGLIGLFKDSLPAIVYVALDTLGLVFFVSSSISWAVNLRGLDCSDTDWDNNGEHLFLSPLLNEGCTTLRNGQGWCGVEGDPYNADSTDQIMANLTSNCKKALGDDVLSFVSAVVIVALLLMSFLLRKRSPIVLGSASVSA